MEPITCTYLAAAAMSGLGRRSLERLVAQREIESRRIGGRRLIVVASLRRYLAGDRPPIAPRAVEREVRE